MDFGTVALIQAIVWVIVGAAFLLIPRQFVAPFGSPMNATADLLGRLLGSAFLSFAVLCWLGREAGDASAQAAVVFPNLLLNALSAVLHTAAVLRGEAINRLGWGIVGLNAALTIAWALVALT